MASPYLIEVRTGGEVKDRLRNIIYDVANRFDVQGASQPRAVPHITLFGPYNTDRGREVKQTLTRVLSDFDIVPYRIAGFGAFEENNVIYANIVPSPEFRRLRRRISRELRPLTYNYQSHDSDFFATPHITIAFRDIDGQFDAIWEYVTSEYDPQFDEYATRVTSLRRRNMLWEYGLLQDRVLSSDEATSRQSWKQTTALLNQQSSAGEHSDLSPEPNTALKYAKYAEAKLLRRW